MSVTKIMLLILCVGHSSVLASITIEDLESLTQSLNMKNLRLIRASNTFNQKLIKEFSNKNVLVGVEKTCEPMRNVNEDLVIFIDNAEMLTTKCIPESRKVLIFLNGVCHNEVYNQLELEINQEVYVFESETKSIYESYQINRVKVNRNIGALEELDGTSLFIWQEGVSSK